MLHRILQQMNTLPRSAWKVLEKKQRTWQILLKRQGLAIEKLDQATQLITTAVKTMLSSKRVQWLFDNQHQDIHCEYQLSYKVNDQTKQIVIDRTFIADNTRWIIDFKITTTNAGESLNNFLQRQQRQHQQQLQTYANTLAAMQNKSIKLGLYFPLLDVWIAWPYLTNNYFATKEVKSSKSSGNG